MYLLPHDQAPLNSYFYDILIFKMKGWRASFTALLFSPHPPFWHAPHKVRENLLRLKAHLISWRVCQDMDNHRLVRWLCLLFTDEVKETEVYENNTYYSWWMFTLSKKCYLLSSYLIMFKSQKQVLMLTTFYLKLQGNQKTTKWQGHHTTLDTFRYLYSYRTSLSKQAVTWPVDLLLLRVM